MHLIVSLKKVCYLSLTTMLLSLASCQKEFTNSLECEGAPVHGITLHYYAATDSFPLIGDEFPTPEYRFSKNDISLECTTSAGRNCTANVYFSQAKSPAQSEITFSFEGCLGNYNLQEPCFEATLSFDGVFTDTLRAQPERLKDGKHVLVYTLNGEQIAEDEDAYRLGQSFLYDVVIYR